MLDLRRLRLLRELGRRGTITAVAEALSYSPSAVSQQLTALEKETGVRLARTSRPPGPAHRPSRRAHRAHRGAAGGDGTSRSRTRPVPERDRRHAAPGRLPDRSPRPRPARTHRPRAATPPTAGRGHRTRARSRHCQPWSPASSTSSSARSTPDTHYPAHARPSVTTCSPTNFGSSPPPDGAGGHCPASRRVPS